MPDKRKVFISYYGEDSLKVEKFVDHWGKDKGIFIPKSIGIKYTDDLIKSTDTKYVMSQIREKYLADSTVTIVLIGSCTHSRRYVDWEIKSSLTQGENNTPNGLIGIFLNSNQDELPERLKDNFNNDTNKNYAKCYSLPTSCQELSDWIEDAFQARIKRAELITNIQDIMKYNSKCKIHKITHNNNSNGNGNGNGDFTINTGVGSPKNIKSQKSWSY